MNKKWMVAVLVGSMCIQSVSLMAMNTEVVTTEVETVNTIEEAVPQVEEKSQVVTRVGEVTSINEANDTYELLVGGEMDGIRFLVQPETLVMNVDTLEMMSVKDIKVGMNVTVVLNKNTPMTMSIPPMCSQQVAILVNSSNKQVEVGYFDETLTNEANTLKLNVSEDTMIQNSRGEKRVFTEEDIKKQDAIVIYSISTRSIPAQTNPEYVMILAPTEEKVVDEEVVVNEKSTTKEMGTDEGYMAVRELATTLGYKVTWDNQTKTVTLTKEDKNIQLVVGKAEYTYNEETVTMKDAVKLEGNTVYIPKALINAF